MSWIHRHRSATPWLLLAPGLVWLAVFFVLPLGYLGYQSLQEGTFPRYEFAWAFSNYSEAISDNREQLVRSFLYAGIATVLALLVSYPLAYWIAFRAGRWKNVFLVLVVAPFFVTYLIRTVAWQTILADQGIVVDVLQTIGALADDGRLLATSTAVVAGITYNYLPFMVLPIYVSLEKIDTRLVEAAKDLYAGPWRPAGTFAGAIVGAGLAGVLAAAFEYDVLVWGAVGLVIGAVIGTLFLSESFIRVVLPLSLPGVFAGSLLVFIPAMGDFVNAELLGNTQTRMIGNVIQSRFLENNDYPTAAALSFILMAGILVAVAIYARVLGTEELTSSR